MIISMLFFWGWVIPLIVCLFFKGKIRFILFCVATVWVIKIFNQVNPVKFYKAVKTDAIVWFKELNAEKIDSKSTITKKLGKVVTGGNQTGKLDLFDIEHQKVVSCSLQAGITTFPPGKYTVHNYEAVFRDSQNCEWKFKYRFNYAPERRVIKITEDTIIALSFGPPFKLITRLAKKDSGQIEITGVIVDSLMNRYTVEKKSGEIHALLNVLDTAGGILYKAEFPCGCGGKYSKVIDRSVLAGKTFRCEIDFGYIPFITDKNFPLYRLDNSRG